MYISLFISAFLAATILPAQSEAVLAYQISESPDEIVLLIAIASFANVLGAVVNWCLGMFAARHTQAWFPVRPETLERAEGRYRKYGRYSLCSAGRLHRRPDHGCGRLLREPLWSFLLLVTIAKSSRYIVVAMLVSGVT